MANPISRLLLTAEADKKSINASEKTFKRLEKQLKAMQRVQAFDKLNKDAADAILSGQKLDKVIGEVNKGLKEMGASADEAARVNTELERMAKNAQRVAESGSTRGAALATFGREARLAAPAIPVPGTNISSEGAFRLVEVAGKLGASLDLLFASIGAGVIVVGSLVAIIQAWQQESAQLRESIRKDIDLNRALNEIKITGTTRVIEAELRALEIRRAITQANLDDENERLALALDPANLGTAGAFGTPEQLIKGLFGVGTEEITEALKAAGESVQELKDIDDEIANYRKALGSQEVAVNDAGEAVKFFSDILLAENDVRIQFANATGKQVRAEIDQQKAIIANNDELLKSTILTEEARKRLGDQSIIAAAILNVLELEMVAVGEATDAAAQALKDAEQAEKDRIKSIDDALRLEKRRAQFIQQLGDFVAAFGRRIQQIQQRAANAIADAQRKLDVDREAAQRKAEISINEAVRKAALKRVEIEKKAAKDIEKILRRSRLAELEAIQERDAVALFAARARRDQELAEANERRDDALEAQKKGASEEIRRIRLNLRERLRTLQIGHNETLRRTRIQVERSVALETEKFKVEFAIRVRNASQTLALTEQEIIQRLTLHAQGASQVVGITAAMWIQMIQIGNLALSKVSSATRQALPQPSPSGGGRSGNPYAASPTPFHRGGIVTRSGQASLLAGEMVVNPAQGGMGGLTINIQGQGKRQVLRAVERALDDYNAGRREAAPAGVMG